MMSDMSGRHLTPIVIGLLAFGAAFSLTHGYGLFGFDSYPILLTSRVQNASDFLNNFSEELMDGRFEGHFYRPLLNLSFALDAAIWKLNPIGYQLSNAILFGAGVALTWILARRLLGPSAAVGAWVAVLTFCFHPTHVEVIPVPSRRPELMVWLLGSASLVLALGSPSKRWVAAGLSFLAMLSKETAFLLPVWIFVAVLVSEHKVRSAYSATVPHAVAFIVAMATRLLVLHGLGGYGNTDSIATLSRAPATLFKAMGLLLMPQPPLRASLAGVPLLILGMSLAVVGILVLFRLLRGRSKALVDPGRMILVGAFWCLTVALVGAPAGRMASWYVFLMVGGWALVMGGLAAIAWHAVRTGTNVTRSIGVAVCVLVSVLILWPAAYSPFIYKYREWKDATVQSRVFLTELERRVGEAENGALLPSPPIPRWVKVRPDAVAVRGAALFSGMTLDAYLELAFPDRRVRLAQRSGARPQANEVLVVPTALIPGFDGP